MKGGDVTFLECKSFFFLRLKIVGDAVVMLMLSSLLEMSFCCNGFTLPTLLLSWNSCGK